MQDREIFSLRVPENLAPSSLGVSVHARKRFPDLAHGAMKNNLYLQLFANVCKYLQIFVVAMKSVFVCNNCAYLQYLLQLHAV